MRNAAIIILLVLSNINSFSQSGTWTWIHGSKKRNALGSYGTKGIPSPTNEPPARYQAAYWTDLQGNFWLFGGVTSIDTIGNYIELNDLWKFDVSTNMWTWVNGLTDTTTILPFANYGTQGIPSATTYPGGTGWGANCWTDHNGDLWLIGGYGYDATNNYKLLNDLWRYNITTNQWTWMSGNGAGNYPGSFGAKGISSPTNMPPGLCETKSSYVDRNGDLWLFGGGASVGYYNTLWRYSIGTNEWTWMSGADSVNAPASYGTINVASPTNTPPGRYTYTKWVDQSDRFYIFSGDFGQTNDTWRFDPLTEEWTWIGGNLHPNDTGLVTGYCQNTNYPKAVYENRTVQTFGCGNYFWDFGGWGETGGSHNPLWFYNAKTNKWSLVSGSQYHSSTGNYGIKGVANTTNIIPSKGGASMWLDNQANVWIFGGLTSDSSGIYVTSEYKNDLWKYSPDTACIHASLTDFTNGNIYVPQPIFWCHQQDTIVKLNSVKVVSVTPSNSVHYNSDSSALIFSPSQSTTYFISVTGGCAGKDTETYSFPIIYLPNPIADFDFVDEYLPTTNPIAIMNSTSQYATSFAWYYNHQLVCTDNNCNLNLGSSLGKRCLTLYAYNAAGCVDSLTKCVEVLESNIFMPNAFSPNGDGVDDYFSPIIFGDVAIKSYRIYNRWGQLIYDDPSAKWDGTYKNTPQPISTYIYTIEAVKDGNSSNAETVKLKGDVILVR